jgi:hypothetical protein
MSSCWPCVAYKISREGWLKCLRVNLESEREQLATFAAMQEADPKILVPLTRIDLLLAGLVASVEAELANI